MPIKSSKPMITSVSNLDVKFDRMVKVSNTTRTDAAYRPNGTAETNIIIVNKYRVCRFKIILVNIYSIRLCTPFFMKKYLENTASSSYTYYRKENVRPPIFIIITIQHRFGGFIPSPRLQSNKKTTGTTSTVNQPTKLSSLVGHDTPTPTHHAGTVTVCSSNVNKNLTQI